MSSVIVQSDVGVTLVGGAALTSRALRQALTRAPCLVAADGGADRALAAGLVPRAVIGDLDSISPAARAAVPPGRLHHLAEQDTTDFDKALRSVVAPFVLALGFAGARIDHGLAVFNALVRHPDKRCLVLGPVDLAFLCPPEMTLRLRVGDRLSLFPMGSVTGRSTGLRWPVAGIGFAPDGPIGTSNMVSAPEVCLAFDAPRMLVILPRARLGAALAALPVAPSWRSPLVAPQWPASGR
jgi:thiamine pyrophosphokinase